MTQSSPDGFGILDPMDTTDLQSIYDQGQSETLAFELEGTPILRLAETYSALANSEGGIVLIGIELPGFLEPSPPANNNQEFQDPGNSGGFHWQVIYPRT